MKRLYLVDAIGPFFRGDDRYRINWSKIPWQRFREVSAEERTRMFEQIVDDMKVFAREAALTGFTAVSPDDVPHPPDFEHH